MNDVPRVLIVYANPAITATPTAPLGAQRIRAIFHGAGCATAITAPWLELDPLAELEKAVESFGPTLVGFSVRNVDDALVVRSAEGDGPIDTQPYLPAIRPLVDAVQRRGIPVLLGGPAMSACPRGVLGALGARFGVVGPADDIAWWLGKALAGGTTFPDALPDDVRIVDHADPESRGTEPSVTAVAAAADVFQPMPGMGPWMPEYVSLLKQRGGWAPVAFSVGCNRRCHFCVEASFLGKRARAIGVKATLDEITALHEQAGLDRFWLTASEINVPETDSIRELLEGLVERGLRVEVRGFLQPAPVTDELLDAFEAAGVDPTALSYEFGHLDDGLLRAGAGPTNLSHIENLVALYRRRGYATVGGTVLFGAHPDETWETVSSALTATKRLDGELPEGLGLAYATGGRVYASSPLGRWVRDHREEATPDLHGTWSEGFAEPLVFCRPAPPRALLAHVQEALADCRGGMGPLNAEMITDPQLLRAERLVNVGIVRRTRGDATGARQALEDAVATVPDHAEALRQLALVLANHFGERERAREVLLTLRSRLSDGTPEADEVDSALAVLSS
ncbi:MAG: radical SAM protein [Proteobacteria bacterium]|nr:radical SAM protein [Pseudomonadota bacterium]